MKYTIEIRGSVLLVKRSKKWIGTFANKTECKLYLRLVRKPGDTFELVKREVTKVTPALVSR